MRKTKAAAKAALAVLYHFIGQRQLRTMWENCSGEEGQFFIDTLCDLVERVRAIPGPYATEGVEAPLAHLHYFTGAADWYIIERDSTDEQLQAFGCANLGPGFSGPELGYISIKEVIGCGAELDLYFEPVPLAEIAKAQR